MFGLYSYIDVCNRHMNKAIANLRLYARIAVMLLADSKALFTLNVCDCVNVNVNINFNVMSMVTLMQRMSLNLFSACALKHNTKLDANVDVDAHAGVKYKQSFTYKCTREI